MKKKKYTMPQISVYTMPELCQLPEVSRTNTDSSTGSTTDGPVIDPDNPNGNGDDSGKDHQGGLWNF